MMKQYSFIGHPYHIILQDLVELFPFIEQVDVIYFEERTPVFKRIRKDETDVSDIIIDIDARPAIMRLVNKWRISEQNILWVKREELPFYYYLGHTESRNLFSDEESNNLVIKVKNEFDGLNDMIFIYLRQEPGAFGMTKSNQMISLDQKTIIAFILDHLVRSQFNKSRNDRHLFNRINENMRSILDQYQSKEDEIQKIKNQYGNSLVKYFESRLQQISKISDCEYVLDDKALEKIRSFTGDIAKLDSVIEDAVTFTSTIFHGHASDRLIIHGYYLNFDKVEVPAQPKADRPRIDSKESRASDLLDKLERAATVVLQKNMRFTSDNVGDMMPTSISAPAITDALKKNKRKVIELLNRYPDRWKTIREQFKPVINLLNKNSNEGRLTSAG